jgi:hypothetical protein
MQMLMALAVLVAAPIHYSNPILNGQLDRWQVLNEQCRGGVSYTCKKKGEQNHETCEDREFRSIKTACWQRLALEKILISKGCEYQAKERPLDRWICK